MHLNSNFFCFINVTDKVEAAIWEQSTLIVSRNGQYPITQIRTFKSLHCMQKHPETSSCYPAWRVDNTARRTR